MPPKVPTPEDFDLLTSDLTFILNPPSPPESTTTFLFLFHGFGDNEISFSSFAKNMNLPGVYSISVRGTSPLPASMLGEAGLADPGLQAQQQHFHWGDDVRVDPSTGDLDDDPGFEKPEQRVLGKLIREVMVEKLGWETEDIILFGFGQGGSLALGLASKLAVGPRVEEMTDSKSSTDKGRRFKGVVSLGGPLPFSMVSTVQARTKSRTKTLMVQVEDDDLDGVKQEFDDVRVVKWKRDVSNELRRGRWRRAADGV